MSNRVAIFLVAVFVLLAGTTTPARADSTTQLPFTNSNGAWLAVDPSGGHVFVSGGSGTSSIVVLDYAGTVIKTITGESGASGMAVDTATHKLYVALRDATAISEIDTQTLTETARFSTAPYPKPTSLVIAGSKLWFSCFQDDGEGCHGVVSANFDGSGMTDAIPDWFFATVLTAGGTGDNLLAVADTYQEPPYVRVYDVSGATPTQVSSIWNPNGGTGFVDDMTFDPSGANLLLAATSPAYLESLTTNTLLSSGAYPIGAYPVAVAMTGDGKFVAAGRRTGTGMGDDVAVYAAGTTTPVRTWRIGDGPSELPGHSLSFSPDASRLFAVAEDSTTGHLAFHVLASPTVPLTATSTSLARSAATVRYGATTNLTVHVSGTGSGTVDLYATPNGQTKKLVATGTLSSGAATFTVKPSQNTTYSAQLERASLYASSTSQDVSVSVSPLLAVASRPAGNGRLRGHRVTKTLLTAKINPIRTGETVAFVIQRRVGSSWHADVGGPVALEGDGTAHAYFLTNRHALFRFQVRYAGDTAFAASKSAWKQFRTKRPG